MNADQIEELAKLRATSRLSELVMILSLFICVHLRLKIA